MKFSLSIFFYSILIACVFFDDPHLYYYKRVVYIVFMLVSLWELYLFNYKPSSKTEQVKMPAWYGYYIRLLLVFIVFNLLIDFFNPNFSLVTQLNHPLAMLAVIPIFAFKVGYQVKQLDAFVRFLFYTCILFYILFFFPIPGKNIQGQAVVCYYAVLPLFIFSMDRKKYLPFTIVTLIIGFYFSQVSESRTIILRILLFLSLLVPMMMFKKIASLKFLVILFVGFMIVQFLTNLDTYLEFFKSFTGVKNFDDEDTRTFLYKEVFGDMKSHELILGRGFQGTYFSDYFLWLQTNNHDFSGDHYFRFSVEVGFLQLLLKGGFVYFLLYITLPVITIYKCLFTRHSSRMAFIISIYILCEIFILFIENIPSYHLQFFIIFFLAGYAYRQASLEAPRPAKNNLNFHDDLHPNTLLQPGSLY